MRHTLQMNSRGIRRIPGVPRVRARSGNAILDMALVLPLLIGLTFGAVEYGYALYIKHSLQAAVREGWVDLVGIGRIVLTYPEILWDATQGRASQRKRICRTFSDCTTAPRNGLPSGCFPLDSYYKDSEWANKLNLAKGIEPRNSSSEIVGQGTT